MLSKVIEIVKIYYIILYLVFRPLEADDDDI